MVTGRLLLAGELDSASLEVHDPLARSKKVDQKLETNNILFLYRLLRFPRHRRLYFDEECRRKSRSQILEAEAS